MKLSWKGKLPTGDALEEEALRCGVSLHSIRHTDQWGGTHFDEAELQRRVLAARAEGRGALLNIVQTVGIIGTLVLTLFVAIWNHGAQMNEQRMQAHQKSAELMIEFGKLIDAGGSGRIVRN
jgi:hypothetical protein